MSSDKDRRRVARDIYLWIRGYDFGSGHFFRSMQKAEPAGRFKLALGFPLEAEMFTEWEDSESEEGFFRKYGVI